MTRFLITYVDPAQANASPCELEEIYYAMSSWLGTIYGKTHLCLQTAALKVGGGITNMTTLANMSLSITL